MRDKDTIEKAYLLTAKAADETQDEQPMESATAFVIMRVLAWILEKEEGDGMFDEVEEEFEELTEDND